MFESKASIQKRHAAKINDAHLIDSARMSSGSSDVGSEPTNEESKAKRMWSTLQHATGISGIRIVLNWSSVEGPTSMGKGDDESWVAETPPFVPSRTLPFSPLIEV